MRERQRLPRSTWVIFAIYLTVILGGLLLACLGLGCRAVRC